ncbi:ATP-binding protein [Streptomyces sp. BA2]|uniref:ATP-binding protein n=1 Tax=Streptomyces sp. BA2 TaxID=436595 RepID=UPI0013213687|nr:ATP-binding protein [Streptomyces sp. BA2]MWA07664.1 ATP-binding protein [Streptomyces sp. BA2]MWA16262.1 ATP-binding protein [Streptomyces sp. BA2]
MTMAAARQTEHPGYNLTLTNAPETAAEARRLVRTAYEAWGVEEYSDTAQVVISELVTNAVRHACGPCIRVIVQHPLPGHLVLAVVDKSRDLPSMHPPHADDLRGRGLLLVDALTEDWGSTRLPWGKRVWAHIEVKIGANQ